MGNNSSHKRTKVPKEVGKKRPPDTDKAPGRQPFFSRFRRKSGTKILLLFSTAERPQLAEAAVGPVPGPGRQSEEPGGSLAAPPTMRGAGDGTEWRAGARSDPGPRRAAAGGRAPRSGRGRDQGQGPDQGQGRRGPPVPTRAW